MRASRPFEMRGWAGTSTASRRGSYPTRTARAGFSRWRGAECEVGPGRTNRLKQVEHDPFASGDVDTYVEATAAQRELWTSSQLGDDAACVFNQSVSVELVGELDLAALRHAFQDLVHRRDALRGTFSADGMLFLIASSVPCGIPLIDLSERSEADCTVELARLIDEDLTRPFDLSRGPLVRAKIVRTAARRHVLLLNVHHVVADGWSVNCIVRELGALYGARLSGASDPLPTPRTFVDYARGPVGPQPATGSRVVRGILGTAVLGRPSAAGHSLRPSAACGTQLSKSSRPPHGRCGADRESACRRGSAKLHTVRYAPGLLGGVPGPPDGPGRSRRGYPGGGAAHAGRRRAGGSFDQRPAAAASIRRGGRVWRTHESGAVDDPGRYPTSVGYVRARHPPDRRTLGSPQGTADLQRVRCPTGAARYRVRRS